MRVVSFYTRSYAGEIARLRRSLERHGVGYSFGLIADGPWDRIVAGKAAWLAGARQTIEGPLLWLDADAVVHEPIDLTPTADVAVRRKGHEWLAGTVLLRDSLGAMRFLQAWAKLNAEALHRGEPAGGEQRNLAKLIENPNGWTTTTLPSRYCWIFDEKGPCPGGPAVEHLQASREFHWYKDKPEFDARLRRDARIRCLNCS